MKKYNAPELEVIKFSHEEILLTSGVEQPSTPTSMDNSTNTFKFAATNGTISYGEDFN